MHTNSGAISGGRFTAHQLRPKIPQQLPSLCSPRLLDFEGLFPTARQMLCEESSRKYEAPSRAHAASSACDTAWSNTFVSVWFSSVETRPATPLSFVVLPLRVLSQALRRHPSFVTPVIFLEPVSPLLAFLIFFFFFVVCCSRSLPFRCAISCDKGTVPDDIPYYTETELEESDFILNADLSNNMLTDWPDQREGGLEVGQSGGCAALSLRVLLLPTPSGDEVD